MTVENASAIKSSSRRAGVIADERGEGGEEEGENDRDEEEELKVLIDRAPNVAAASSVDKDER